MAMQKMILILALVAFAGQLDAVEHDVSTQKDLLRGESLRANLFNKKIVEVANELVEYHPCKTKQLTYAVVELLMDAYSRPMLKVADEMYELARSEYRQPLVLNMADAYLRAAADGRAKMDLMTILDRPGCEAAKIHIEQEIGKVANIFFDRYQTLRKAQNDDDLIDALYVTDVYKVLNNNLVI